MPHADFSSVQHGPLGSEHDARVLARDYFVWLAHRVPFLAIDDDGTRVTFRALGIVGLELERTLVDPTRVVLAVRGGALAHPSGEMSFVVEKGVLETALHGYRTRLPTLLYRVTQLPLHGFVMRAFLKRVGPVRALPSSTD
jgi:hypothetical protein